MLNKLRLGLAAFRIYRDPDRLGDVLDAVSRLASSNDVEQLAEILEASSPAASEALRAREVIQYDPLELARCPEGSLGRAVHDHCAAYGIHPSTFPQRPAETAGQFALVHIENTHDIWHPVCGFGSDAMGEIGLQAFYLAQFPNLLGLLLLGIAPLHLLSNEPFEYPRLMEEITRGWLLGKRAKPLFGFRWDRVWDRPLEEVRRELGIDIEAVQRIMEPGTTELSRRLFQPVDRPS
jgi:ubiquinone biosynthesis protein Coq4